MSGCLALLSCLLCCNNAQLSAAKVNPSKHEKSVIESLDSLMKHQSTVRRKRKKRAKGPNPLSVKASYKFSAKSKEVAAGIVTKSKVMQLQWFF